MASFKVFRRVYLVLMLYLASTSSLAHSEADLQINPRTTNTTHSGDPISVPDPRNPSFLANVVSGLNIATGLAGHQVFLVEIITTVPSGYPSSNMGDFTSIMLSVYDPSTRELAGLSSSQPWGTWDHSFSFRRPGVPHFDIIMPLTLVAAYDQRFAFTVLPDYLGPWFVVFLRVGSTRDVVGPIWHFGNFQRHKCHFAWKNHDGSWTVDSEPMWGCAWSSLPANVSVPQAISLADANNNVTSSSPNLPLSTAGSIANEVALPVQNHDAINEPNGEF